MHRSLIAWGDLDYSTPVPVRRTNDDHHHCTCEHHRAAEAVFGLAIKGIEVEDIDARLTAVEEAALKSKQGR